MAHYTYSGDPTASSRDEVRFLLRDTGPTTWQLSDEEIVYLNTKFGTPVKAAAFGAERIASNFQREVKTKTVGSLSLTYEVAAATYKDLAKALKAAANSGIVAIAAYAGGISASDKELQRSDTDATPYNFFRGMHDHPGTSDFSRIYRLLDDARYD